VRIAFQVVGERPIDLIFVNGMPSPVDVIWDEPAAANFLRRLSLFRLVLSDARGSTART